jgi:hypothetical protein
MKVLLAGINFQIMLTDTICTGLERHELFNLLKLHINGLRCIIAILLATTTMAVFYLDVLSIGETHLQGIKISEAWKRCSKLLRSLNQN